MEATATAPFTFQYSGPKPKVMVARTEIRSNEISGDEAFGYDGINPFETLAGEWEGDFDSPHGNANRATLRERRHRLARLLDSWVATVPVKQDTIAARRSTLGDAYEPELMVEFSQSLKEALQGRIIAPLDRFAAIGVAADRHHGRAEIGQVHSEATLDRLGGALLMAGMGLAPDMWPVNNTRYLVMNLDREGVDESLHLGNVVGGLLFAERSWPEA